MKLAHVIQSVCLALMVFTASAADNKTNIVTGVTPRMMTNAIISLVLTNGISDTNSALYGALSNLLKNLVISGNVSTNLPLGNVVGLTVINEVQSNGTDGGTFTGTLDAGTWVTRTLNTITTNGAGGITLAANEFTIPANVAVIIEASAPGYGVDYHKSRLYDVTAAAALVYGTTEYSDEPDGAGADSAQTRSHLVTYIAAKGAANTYRVEHICTRTRATDGLGRADVALAGDEMYTVVKITVIDIN